MPWLSDKEQAHARLGPSSAHRWLRCPASVVLSEQVPQRPAGAAAQAGTILHDVYERKLLGRHDFSSFELAQLSALEVSPDRARQIIEQAVEATYQALSRYQLREFLTETRVNPGATMQRTDYWGTADVIAADASSRVLLVGDLKTGRGRVEVEANDQLFSYALGALSLLQFVPDRIVLAIFQPPVFGATPALWETDLLTLHAFAKYAEDQAALTDLPNPPAYPSQEACLWCSAKSICPDGIRR